jgi:hypothetical protein
MRSATCSTDGAGSGRSDRCCALPHGASTTVPHDGQRSAELPFLMSIEVPPPTRFFSGIHFTPTRKLPIRIRPLSVSVPQFGQFIGVPMPARVEWDLSISAETGDD